MEFSYEGSCRSTLESAKPFLFNLTSLLNQNFGMNELMRDVRLILSELVVNSTVHGNLSNCDKRVFVRVSVYPSKILIDVEDEGQGILKSTEEYGVRCNLGQYDALSESGRGLEIVRLLSDRLEFLGNRVHVELTRH